MKDKQISENKASFPAKLIDAACDLSSFCSTDESRKVITGVHFGENGVEATDGCMMIRVPYPGYSVDDFPFIQGIGNETQDSILPAKEVSAALKTIPKKINFPILKNAKLTQKVGSESEIQVTTFDLDNAKTASIKKIDDTYPNLNQVWPTDEPKLSISLLSKYLKKIADYAEKYGQEQQYGKGVVIKFEFVDELSPARIEFILDRDMQSHEEARAKIVLMPMRMF